MKRDFVPAAGHDFFLPLYDPLWRLLGGRDVRAEFIRDADLADGQRILDVGCGTGNLAIEIAEAFPGAEIYALDPDPKALKRAADKAVAAGRRIEWKQGFADELPFEDASFDRVVSSFMFHHLDPDTKRGMLREVFRVLSENGQLHLVDFGGVRSDESHGHSHGDGLLARLFHSHEHREDGLAPTLFESAGFEDIAELSQKRSVFGRYAHTRGVRPRLA